MARRLQNVLGGTERPSFAAGVVVAFVSVAIATALVFPLKDVAPVVSLGVVYLLGVLVISAGWGLRMGVLTALVSAAAFNWFHIPPTGRFTIREPENWVALAAFLVAAVIASTIAQVARTRAREAEERRREADLAAEMARLLLRGGNLVDGLATAASRLATALDVPSAAIELERRESDKRNIAFPLREERRRLGTLVVPSDLPETTLRRLQERVVPALEALLAAALEREALQDEVVETEALRHSDVVKTALLRSVSHDLRSPLTAIVTAGDALRSPTLADDDRRELAAVVAEEARRLARLIDNLLDLSRLQAGVGEPRTAWCSVEEILRTAAEDTGAPPQALSFTLDPDLPQVRADAAQLERAFANVLENSVGHSGDHPVSVRARAVGGRLIVRVVDRGPGIPPAQLERVFEPFYTALSTDGGRRGSGLGLAIARGFIEANGGQIVAESLPRQGTTFVVTLPLPARATGGEERPSTEGARVP